MWVNEYWAHVDRSSHTVLYSKYRDKAFRFQCTINPTYLIGIFVFTQLSLAMVHNPEEKSSLKGIPKTLSIYSFWSGLAHTLEPRVPVTEEKRMSIKQSHGYLQTKHNSIHVYYHLNSTFWGCAMWGLWVLPCAAVVRIKAQLTQRKM